MDSEDWKDYKQGMKEAKVCRQNAQKESIEAKLKEYGVEYEEAPYSFIVKLQDKTIDVWYTKNKCHVRGTKKYPHVSKLWEHIESMQ